MLATKKLIHWFDTLARSDDASGEMFDDIDVWLPELIEEVMNYRDAFGDYDASMFLKFGVHNANK